MLLSFFDYLRMVFIGIGFFILFFKKNEAVYALM